MKNSTKIWILSCQIVVLWAMFFALEQFPGVVKWYSETVFPALQITRNSVFSITSVSLGDVLYFLLGLWLLVSVIRFVYFTSRWRRHKERVLGIVLNGVNTFLAVYIVFIVFWGANYSKEPLARFWGLPSAPKGSRQERRAHDMTVTVALNQFLVGKLNRSAPKYRALPNEHINERSIAYYREYTNCSVKDGGLGVKTSLYSALMQWMSVDGYYNPLTAEGQVNNKVPGFMMPFITCHEMAHQAGIAAEGDANLMAYAVCTHGNDEIFKYSAYLNLWLYANNRLYRYDSGMANSYQRQLNELTLRHLDTLEAISAAHRGFLSHFTSNVYDSYLKLQNQENGIRSYGNVTREAWLWEQARARGRKLIKIP
ncbi:MAG: DUF3810 domain-containing protein [Flavipsychrobacter sp.]|nr:DUF3810 domain-containing protein [Flavipsychrobacter sp.]